MSHARPNVASRTTVAVVALAGAALAPAPADAQWRAEASVAAGRAALPTRAAGPATFSGTVSGSVARSLAARGRWSLELVADASDEAVAGSSGGDARTVARVAWGIDARSGVQLDAGGSAAWRRVTERAYVGAPNPADTTLALQAFPRRTEVASFARGITGGLGAWTRLRGVLLTANARTTAIGNISESFTETRYRMVDSAIERQRFDTLNGFWKIDTIGWEKRQQAYTATGERVRRLLQTDVSLGASSGRGALGFAFAGGVRRATFGDGGEGWGTARATWAVHRDFALSLQASRFAADAIRSLPARRELQLGVMLKPWGHSATPVSVAAAATPRARSFAARPTGDGRVTLVLHAPGARSVELMGDFTSWRVIALERGRGDTWQATLPLDRGVHHLNIRIDGGEWTPPPGLGVGDDGFGGTFGLLVL